MIEPIIKPTASVEIKMNSIRSEVTILRPLFVEIN
jgi:hypothetical protein